MHEGCVRAAHGLSGCRSSSAGSFLPGCRGIELLLRDCRNLAMPGLAVGLLVRHPELAGPELWRLEADRAFGEGPGTLHVQGPDPADLRGRACRGLRFDDVAAGMTVQAALVRTIGGRGVRFLSTPASYYDALPQRLGPADLPMDLLRELNILADRDRWGMMLQIFSESRYPRRTFFYEVIERRGARSFGSSNIKALYEAVDRQAAARPTLSG